ncbi:hypothetical protein D3C83_76590 [compost metagenome]
MPVVGDDFQQRIVACREIVLFGADAVMHVEHRVRRRVQIARFHHAARAAAAHQHDGVVLDRESSRAIRHHRAGHRQLRVAEQHAAQIHVMDAEV